MSRQASLRVKRTGRVRTRATGTVVATGMLIAQKLTRTRGRPTHRKVKAKARVKNVKCTSWDAMDQTDKESQQKLDPELFY